MQLLVAFVDALINLLRLHVHFIEESACCIDLRLLTFDLPVVLLNYLSDLIVLWLQIGHLGNLNLQLGTLCLQKLSALDKRLLKLFKVGLRLGLFDCSFLQVFISVLKLDPGFSELPFELAYDSTLFIDFLSLLGDLGEQHLLFGLSLLDSFLSLFITLVDSGLEHFDLLLDFELAGQQRLALLVALYLISQALDLLILLPFFSILAGLHSDHTAMLSSIDRIVTRRIVRLSVTRANNRLFDHFLSLLYGNSGCGHLALLSRNRGT